MTDPRLQPKLPDLRLLAAVTDATMTTGWATASEIRAALDGLDGRGRWAKVLHEHVDAGFLERRGYYGPYALTDKAVEALHEDFYV